MDEKRGKDVESPETRELLEDPEGRDPTCGKQQEEDEEEVSVKCGVEGCAPSSIQPCADVRAFTANSSVLLLLAIAAYTYIAGNARTLERRFGLSSTEINLIGPVADLVSTFIGLIIGYLGHRMHKPRVISFSNLLLGFGVLLFALPYAIYGPKDISTSPSITNTSSWERPTGLCQPDWNATSIDDACAEQDAGSDVSLETIRRGAWTCFLVASGVMFGIGGPGVGTLALPYLDENCNHGDSALYIGIITSMYAWAPIMGFLLAAVCTRIPENLIGSPGLTPDDPRWIGAWWVGFLIIGIPFLLFSLPLWLFPKHLNYYYKTNKKTPKPKETGVKKFSASKEMKNFWRSLLSLLSNFPFVMMVLSNVCGLYIITGIYLQQPRYMEIHFGLPAYMANIVSGTSGAVVGALGNILGGVLMKHFNIGVVGSARMYVYSLIIGAACTAVSMFLACPESQMTGTINPVTNRLDMDSACNSGCGCVPALNPVCVNVTTNYISPCHAGCMAFDTLNKTYSDCACAGPEVSVTEGYCSQSTCVMLIPYIVVGIIGSLLGSIANVPSTMLLFRVVKMEEKSFAIGILTFAINLLCFVPSPIVFGRLLDSTCRLWEESCGSRGACLLYDITKYRLFMHGVTLVFEVASLAFAIVVLIYVTRKQRQQEPAASDPAKAARADPE